MIGPKPKRSSFFRTEKKLISVVMKNLVNDYSGALLQYINYRNFELVLAKIIVFHKSVQGTSERFQHHSERMW